MPHKSMASLDALFFKNSNDPNQDNPDKDDDTKLSQKFFAALAFMTMMILFLWIYNGRLLFITGKIKRNVPLVLFYIFSLITLICNIRSLLIYIKSSFCTLWTLHLITKAVHLMYS